MTRIAILLTALAMTAGEPGHSAIAQTAVGSTAGAPQHATAAHRRHKPAGAVHTTGAAPHAPPSTWTGTDPTKGPGIEQLRELQRQGRCVVDEGYGRYTFCNNM